MTKVVIYCDRCGKEFECWNYKHKELIGIADFVSEGGDRYLNYQKDLCESCYTELENWWNAGSQLENKELPPHPFE